MAAADIAWYFLPAPMRPPPKILGAPRNVIRTPPFGWSALWAQAKML
jgi:hypothetical protein